MEQETLVTLKELYKKGYTNKDKRSSRISKALFFEIKKTQDLLQDMYKKKYGKKKYFSALHASDFIAERYRRMRYKI